MATVVLDPGHGGTAVVGGSSPNNAKGPRGTLEKAVTLQVGFSAREALEAAGIHVLLTRSADVNVGLADRARVARQADAAAFISIHFNGFNNSTQGTETWVAPDASRASRSFAGIMQPILRAATGLKDRGVKDEKSLAVLRTSSHAANTAAILVEISFMDVPAEEARLLEPTYVARLGAAISDGVLSYLRSVGSIRSSREFGVAEIEDGWAALNQDAVGNAGIRLPETREFEGSESSPIVSSAETTQEILALCASLRARVDRLEDIAVGSNHGRSSSLGGSEGLESTREDVATGEAGREYSFKTAGLTKSRFLAENGDAILLAITDANAALDGFYGTETRGVSFLDFAVMLNCEAGIKAKGIIDPDFRHSEGERGLFPLPSNLVYWNGQFGPTPSPNSTMPLSSNIWQFMLYLGQLKNKEVGRAAGRALFCDLFRFPGISGSTKREARLLAGVVHGYFTRSNYGGSDIPFTHILNGYARDVPLPELMRPTRYRHAGTTIMSNRHANIEDILVQFGDDGE